MVRDRGDRTTHDAASPPMPASKSRGATMAPRGHDDQEPQMLRPPMITPSHTKLQAQRSVVSLDLTSSTPPMESTGRTVGDRSPMGLSDVVELPCSGCMAIILFVRPITTVCVHVSRLRGDLRCAHGPYGPSVGALR